MATGQTPLQETVIVNLEHVKQSDPPLAEQIQVEWLRLEPQLRQAVQRLVREIDPEFVKGDDQNERVFCIAWEGFNEIERLRDLRSAKVLCQSGSNHRCEVPGACIPASLRGIRCNVQHIKGLVLRSGGRTACLERHHNAHYRSAPRAVSGNIQVRALQRARAQRAAAIRHDTSNDLFICGVWEQEALEAGERGEHIR